MQSDRRNILAALAIPAALAACAQDGTPSDDTRRIFNQIAYLLPVIKAAAVGLSIAVPPFAPALAAVPGLIDLAADQFQLLEQNMTRAAAQPIVSKIATYAGQALDLIEGQIAAAPVGSRLSGFKGEIENARQVFALVVAFATGVTSMPTSRSAALPRLVHR